MDSALTILRVIMCNLIAVAAYMAISQSAGQMNQFMVLIPLVFVALQSGTNTFQGQPGGLFG